jgi:hypothetical protein
MPLANLSCSFFASVFHLFRKGKAFLDELARFFGCNRFSLEFPQLKA